MIKHLTLDERIEDAHLRWHGLICPMFTTDEARALVEANREPIDDRGDEEVIDNSSE